MQMIIRSVPDTLHRQLKIMAIKKGVTLNQLLINLLAERINCTEV